MTAVKSISNKDLAKEVRNLVKNEGWVVVPGKKHVKLRAPDGSTASISSTPGDWRALKNFKADIRRIQSISTKKPS